MRTIVNYVLFLLLVFFVPIDLCSQERATSTQRPAPVAPTNLTALGVSTSQINLTWTANSNDAAGFIVERAPSAAGPWTQIAIISADITSCASLGLSPATVYYYRVGAYNSLGKSFSKVVSTMPLSPLPVGAPTKLVATRLGSPDIKLAWTNNASDATGFKIERCQGRDCSTFEQLGTVTGNETSYEDRALAPATSYSYRIRAYNSTSDSGYTNTATVVTLRRNVSLDAPLELTANPISSSKVALSWTPAQKTSGEITGYNIYQNGERLSSAKGTTFTVTDLDPMKLYCFTVAAFDKLGDDIAESALTCVTTKADWETGDQKTDIRSQRPQKPKPNR